MPSRFISIIVLPVLLLVAIAAPVGAARRDPALPDDWERVKAADRPVGYARFLEAHPRFEQLGELEELLAEANRRAVAAGAQVEIPLATLEPAGANVYRGDGLFPHGRLAVTFSFAFEGELSVGTGGAAKRNFGSKNAARLVPGIEGEPGRGSWATLAAGESHPILAIVWGPGGFLPPVEVYVAGAPLLHFRSPAPAPEPEPGGATSGSVQVEPVPRGDGADFTAFDEPPVPIKIFRPDYPDGARQARIEGTVLVRITVSEIGRAIAAEVVRSNATPALEEAAAGAALLSLFRPAMRGGVPVKARVVVPFRFELD